MSTKQSTSKKKDPSTKQISSLKKELKKLELELKEKDDKLLRSYADLQNYQKRMEKELQLKEQETKKKYISELIDLKELLKKAFEDKLNFTTYFGQFLKAAYRANKKVLLIIDEAQNISLDLLEEIRLLSNIEISEKKLLNIFFV